MEEIVFFTEKDERGKLIARHFREENITSEGSSIKELKEAIISYYREYSIPFLIRLYFKKERYDITFYTKNSELSMLCL